MVMNLYRNIDKSKIQFDYVVHIHNDSHLFKEAVKLGAKVYYCPRFNLQNSFNYIMWWWSFLDSHKEYKIIHSHVRSTAAIVLMLAKKMGYVTISHSHSTSSGKGIVAIIKNCLQYPIRFVADYFMACSDRAGKWLFGRRIYGSPNYFTVNNSIDSKKYIYNNEVSERIRYELNISPEDFVIGHVGRFTEPKNYPLILEIFEQIIKRKGRYNYRLLLVGDGELKEEIIAWIKEKKLEDKVILTGMRADANEIMMAMDLFLFPSKWEGLGMVVIEAQATGCKCLVSTEVPKETNISNLIEYIPLKAPLEQWNTKILSIEKYEKRDMHQRIIDANYDIRRNVEWFEQFYLNISEGNKCI